MNEPAPIRVLVTDDHAAVRAGLRALLESEPGMEVSGEATDAFDFAPAIYATRPDVVVLDYQLPGGNGISLCRELKRAVSPPSVVLYSAFAGDSLIVPAHVAGAEALLDKATAPRKLALVIRRVVAGERLLPTVSDELLNRALERLPPGDGDTLRHLVAGTSAQLDPDELQASIDRILANLVADPRAVSA